MAGRHPRDAQRARVYRAEHEIPWSPLPGLPACATFVDRVVGSLWWQLRFPDRDLGSVPRLRDGRGARTAFYHDDDDGRDPSITLPRRYRTKGVVLHELCHWALSGRTDLAHHGPEFTRLLLDATAEFLGTERATALAEAYAHHRVKVADALLVQSAPNPGLIAPATR